MFKIIISHYFIKKTFFQKKNNLNKHTKCYIFDYKLE